jgi:hypothetical protein
LVMCNWMSKAESACSSRTKMNRDNRYVCLVKWSTFKTSLWRACIYSDLHPMAVKRHFSTILLRWVLSGASCWKNLINCQKKKGLLISLSLPRQNLSWYVRHHTIHCVHMAHTEMLVRLESCRR